jgi:hypothetical protein
MAEGDDFFGSYVEDIPRDRWGRPLITPVGMPPEVKLPYTRASSLADFISNMRSIHIWEKRYLARGLGIREDLAALASAETYNTGFGETDDPENQASGRRLDDIARRAMDAVRLHEKADYGTAIHAFTEPGAPTTAPERMKSDVASFWAALDRHGIRLVETERFVVDDELRAAGTGDHLAEVPGIDGLVVVDKKTGTLRPREFSVQLSVYAHGQFYDPRTCERTPMPAEVNQEVALIAHIPAGQGRTDFYVLDIAEGRKRAKLAAAVRDDQAAPPTMPLLVASSPLIQMIAGAETLDDLKDFYYGHRAAIDADPEASIALRGRIQVLGG